MNKNIIKLIFVCIMTLFTSCSDENQLDTKPEQTDNTPTDSSNNNTSKNTAFEIEILNLINKHRTEKGLKKLIILDKIKPQTDLHTDYMIEKGELSHDNFKERVTLLQKKITGMKKSSENVAYNYSNAKSVVNGWLSSSEHKANIEGDFTHFNLTAKQNSKGNWYFTNLFVKII